MNRLNALLMIAALAVGCTHTEEPEAWTVNETEGPSTSHQTDVTPDPQVDTDPEPQVDPDPDPQVDPDPVAEPGLVTCVSEFVNYDGTHYVVRFGGDAAPDGAQMARVMLPTGLDPNVNTERAEEAVVASWTFDASDSFAGFEDNGAWLRPTKQVRDGLWNAEMFIPEADDHSLLSEQTELAATCFRSDLDQPASYRDGACLDAAGNPAMNDVDFRVVLHTGDGQCADLRGETLNGNALGYPVFQYVDLRGADLRSASLHFASILDARLEGANMSSFEFGYAIISGSTDDATVAPNDTTCLGTPEEEASPTNDDERSFRCMR